MSKELVTVEFSRTNTLSDVCVVGSQEEITAVIERMIKMDSATIDRIVARIETLDMLRISDLHSNSTEESLDNILTITHTPPIHGFVHHDVFRDRSYFSFIDITAKRIEIQMREDNIKQQLTIVEVSSYELFGFIHGFQSEDEHEEMLSMIANQTQTNLRYHIHHPP